MHIRKSFIFLGFVENLQGHNEFKILTQNHLLFPESEDLP